MSMLEDRKRKLETLKPEDKNFTHLMCSKKELLICTKENSMEHLKATCTKKSLKADSKALFILAKL